MQNFGMSSKLNNVCYDIRGPVLKHAKRMEEADHPLSSRSISDFHPGLLRSTGRCIDAFRWRLNGRAGLSKA